MPDTPLNAVCKRLAWIHWCFNWQGASAPRHFWDVWQLFNLGDPKGILWSALPRQLPTVLALAFVVAFGSSLDVAAIQQGSPDELDYNRELVTVGMQLLLYVASLPSYHYVHVVPRADRTAAASTAPRFCRPGLSNVLAGAVGAGMTGACCIAVLMVSCCVFNWQGLRFLCVLRDN